MSTLDSFIERVQKEASVLYHYGFYNPENHYLHKLTKAQFKIIYNRFKDFRKEEEFSL